MNIPETLKNALNLRNQKLWQDCLTLIENLNPEHAAAKRYHRRLLLECHFHLNQFTKAHIALTEALALNPEGRELEALIYWQGRLESSLTEDVTSSSGMEKLGLQYLREKKWQAAQSTFNSLCQKYPQDAKHRYHLGISYLESGDLAKAIINLKHCVQIDCLMQKAWYALGSVFLSEGLTKNALEYFTEGYSADPFHADGLACHKALKDLKN